MFQVMHEQMYGSAKRRQEETFCQGMPSLPSPSPEYAQASRQTGPAPFDFMLKNKAICLLFDFRKYSQNASKSTEATLKGI